MNLGRPLSKAKYLIVTDSELVPRGKGEKNPVEGSEIESETVYLQPVRGRCCWIAVSLIAYLLHNDPTSYRMWQG